MKLLINQELTSLYTEHTGKTSPTQTLILLLNGSRPEDFVHNLLLGSTPEFALEEEEERFVTAALELLEPLGKELDMSPVEAMNFYWKVQSHLLTQYLVGKLDRDQKPIRSGLKIKLPTPWSDIRTKEYCIVLHETNTPSEVYIYLRDPSVENVGVLTLEICKRLLAVKDS